MVSRFFPKTYWSWKQLQI